MPLFSAGSAAKSDCLVSYEPGEAELVVRVESKVGVLFGRALAAVARDLALEAGAGGSLLVRDDGALDHVVAARTEAALLSAGLVLPRRAASGEPRERSPRDRLRRSRLYMPGNEPDLVLNAGLFGADCILLDLEDSVPQERKSEARILVRRLLEGQRRFFGASELAVRVNPLATAEGLADLEALVAARPEALVLPKCEAASEVLAWDREVTRLEAEAGIEAGFIRFMPLVETARGVLSAQAIAAASPRNVALCFGAEDYRRDLGIERLADEAESFTARSLVAMAARAASIGAQDSVFSDLEDAEGLEASARAAKGLGFTGKGVLHPSQIEIVHRVFDPSPLEIARATRIVEALKAAEAEGRGVASLDGRMIDAPVAERARLLLARAARSGPGARHA
jgi:citrate lyase subunit beta/citryl-CoA lyase